VWYRWYVRLARQVPPVILSSIHSRRNTPFLRPFGDARFLRSAGKYYVISFFRGFKLGLGFVPCTLTGPTVRTLGTTLLLNISSTTEPIQRRIGSVIEVTFNNHSPITQGPDPKPIHTGATIHSLANTHGNLASYKVHVRVFSGAMDKDLAKQNEDIVTTQKWVNLLSLMLNNFKNN
jgi:hypothetical protein